MGLTPSVRWDRSVMVEGKRSLMWNWADRREPKHPATSYTHITLQLYDRIWTRLDWPTTSTSSTDFGVIFHPTRYVQIHIMMQLLSFLPSSIRLSHYTKQWRHRLLFSERFSHDITAPRQSFFTIFPASYGDEPLEMTRAMPFFSILHNRIMLSFWG